MEDNDDIDFGQIIQAVMRSRREQDNAGFRLRRRDDSPPRIVSLSIGDRRNYQRADQRPHYVEPKNP